MGDKKGRGERAEESGAERERGGSAPATKAIPSEARHGEDVPAHYYTDAVFSRERHTGPVELKLEPTEEARLLQEIDAALREVKRLSAEAHVHDEEMARLRKETRGLIDEMLRDLNLKAA